MSRGAVRRPLADLALARSGDKGDTADVTVLAPAGELAQEVYALLVEEVTAERVAELLGELVQGPVTRHEAPNLLALKFVCERALGGGGPRSLRADNLGKALGGAILRLEVAVPADLSDRLGARPAPRDDPYADASWLVR